MNIDPTASAAPPAPSTVESVVEASSIDVIVELYKRDVDRTLLIEQRRKTPARRAEDLESMCEFAHEMRAAVTRTPSSPPQFGALLRALTATETQFIIVGGVAGVLLGAARTTVDLDVVYARSRENLCRLVAALEPLQVTLRGAPPGLPFRLDGPTLEGGLNFSLSTNVGPLDLLGEVVGGGGYDRLLQRSHEVEAFGVRCRHLNLDALIAVKRAAGLTKDFEPIAELEILRDLDRGERTASAKPPS